jgi:hypothetical protein
VEETEWNELTPAGYTSDYLTLLGGLKTVLVLFGDGDEDSEQESEIKTEELYKRADELRAEYAESLKHEEVTAKSFWCVDRSGLLF